MLRLRAVRHHFVGEECGEWRVEMKLGSKRPGFLLLTVILEGGLRPIGSKKTPGRLFKIKPAKVIPC